MDVNSDGILSKEELIEGNYIIRIIRLLKNL